MGGRRGGYRLSTAINIVTISRGPRCPGRVSPTDREHNRNRSWVYGCLTLARIQQPPPTVYRIHTDAITDTISARGCLKPPLRARARENRLSRNESVPPCERKTAGYVAWSVHGNPFPRCVVSCSLRGSPCRP